MGMTTLQSCIVLLHVFDDKHVTTETRRPPPPHVQWVGMTTATLNLMASHCGGAVMCFQGKFGNFTFWLVPQQISAAVIIYFSQRSNFNRRILIRV